MMVNDNCLKMKRLVRQWYVIPAFLGNAVSILVNFVDSSGCPFACQVSARLIFITIDGENDFRWMAGRKSDENKTDL